MTVAQPVRIPFVIRGEVIDDCKLEFGGRAGGICFTTPDLNQYIDKLLMRNPSQMGDLYSLTFDDILDFLVRLGESLKLSTNTYLQQAFEVSCKTSGLSEPILRYYYERIPMAFMRDVVKDSADRLVGIKHLESWVPDESIVHQGEPTRIRAFGARCVHIIPGNVPTVSVGTAIRNAFTRSDAIVKSPSNDPMTAYAIARSMVELDADHPLTRHMSVVYWKGGDQGIEESIYDPRAVEKIVAWGGFDSIKHVTRYLQPGLDLITLDPKHSSTIIGPEAFASDEVIQSVAKRLALDIGGMNQEGCVNARVIYVCSGCDKAGLERINRLGELTFEALQNLPDAISTPHENFDPLLKDEIEGLRYTGDDFRIFGGKSNEGAIIVSQESEPVDFSRLLACRVGNLVPIDHVDSAVRSVNSYTQTIGIFPESLKLELRDRLSYQGAQRLVSLGAATVFEDAAIPQDGIEPVRRMCKWITDSSTPGDRLVGIASGEIEP